MPVLASYVIDQERIDLATPNAGSGPRWSDTQLLSMTDRAVKDLVADVLFPETRLTINTVPGVNEYPLPDTHVIHRVYCNGQLVVPVPGGIETLNAQQILGYDQTGNPGGTQNAAGVSSGTYAPFYVNTTTQQVAGYQAPTPGSVPAYGSATPAGTQGSEMPQWLAQTPTTYPFLNAWGAPAPEVQPWFPGQRPRYYINGGNLGLVPAPASKAQLVVDCVLVPQTLTSTDETLPVPDNFVDGIIAYVLWRAARAAAMSDRSPASAQNRQEALGELEREKRKLRTWKRQFTLESAQTMVLTYRGFFRVGGHKASSSGDAW